MGNFLCGVETFCECPLALHRQQPDCLAKVGYFNLKQNPTVQVHFKESSPLRSLLPLCGLS